MPILKCNSKLILFIHIPKTGGTSIESYLKRKGSLVLYDPLGPAHGISCVPQHFHGSILERLFNDDFFDARFTVVRDPVERMISEFQYQVGRTKKNISSVIVESFGKHRIAIGGREFRVDFDEWVDRILDAYEKDPFIQDNHLRPQVDFITEKCRVFEFSSGLEKVFDFIDEATKTFANQRPDRLNTSKYMQISPSQKTLNKIEAFYQHDFALIRRIRKND